MSAMLQILFFSTIVLCVFAVGLPFSILGLNEKNKCILVPFSVLAGTVCITLVSYYLSVMGLSMRSFAKPVLILLLMCSLCLCIFFRKRLAGLMTVELLDLAKICLCVLAGGIVLAPVILYNGGFTYVDTYTYVSIADVLQDIGYNKVVLNDIYMPYLTQINLYQEQGYRIGAQMLLAFFTAFFSRGFSIEMYSPITALGVVCCGCGAWIFVELNYYINKMSSLLSVLLVTLNVPVVIWSGIYGFLPQVYGLAFFMAAYALMIAVVRNDTPKIFEVNCVFCAMFIALLGLGYNELLPFYVLTVLGFLIMNLVLNRKEKSILLGMCKKLIIITGATIIILGPYFLKMIKAIVAQFKVNSVGWEHLGGIWTFLGYVLGTVPADFYYQSIQYSISSKIYYTVLTVAIILLLFEAIYKLCKEKHSMVLDMLISFLPFFIMLLYFGFFTINPFGDGKGNKWSIYKVIQYSIVIILPYSGVLLSSLWSRKKWMIGMLSILMTITSICNGIYYADLSVEPIRQLTGNRENPMGEYYKLYDTYKNCEKKIYVIGAPNTHRRLITYFLQKNKLMSDWGTDDYFYVYHDFIPEYKEDGLVLYYNPYCENPIANFEKIQQFPIMIEWGEVFFSQESNDTDTWNWCSEGEGIIEVKSYSHEQNIKIYLELSCVEPSMTDIVISNESGGVIKTISVNNQVREPVEIPLDFSDGECQKLFFSYEGSGLQTETGRTITFGLWNVTVKED